MTGLVECTPICTPISSVPSLIDRRPVAWRRYNQSVINNLQYEQTHEIRDRFAMTSTGDPDMDKRWQQRVQYEKNEKSRIDRRFRRMKETARIKRKRQAERKRKHKRKHKRSHSLA